MEDETNAFFSPACIVVNPPCNAGTPGSFEQGIMRVQIQRVMFQRFPFFFFAAFLSLRESI
jgi:hypothetical protein